MDNIIYPTVKGMAAEGHRYQGFLYAGLMIDKQGIAKVIEFNCRFGDPETQPIMMRMQSDLVDLCLAGAKGELAGKDSIWDPRPALGVVMAAGGYPDNYRQNDIIEGLTATSSSTAKVFQAGTKLTVQGEVVTAGGRVLCATALGEDIEQAQKNAYALAKSIHWYGCFYRHDIGYRAIARLKK